MSYALQTLWHEKTRYAAGVGAVAFSALLIALQVGLMLGLFELTSIPVDHTSADVWIGSKDVQSVDLGKPILINTHMARLTERPGYLRENPELMLANFSNFRKANGGTEMCFILGAKVDPNVELATTADVLTPELRAKLSEPYTFVIDQSDMSRLGLTQINDTAKINDVDVKCVGTVTGLRSLAAPWIFCSFSTARKLLTNFIPPDHTTYLLARCHTPEQAQELVKNLRHDYPDMASYTAEDFSFSCRYYWLTRTKAGVAIGYAALLGLLVGAVITAQTLYSATMASAREFATLLALGIPRKKIYGLVMAQSFWVGIIGVILAYPAVRVLGFAAESAGTKVQLRWEVLGGAALITIATALLAGLFALRSVRRIEPLSLLR